MIVIIIENKNKTIRKNLPTGKKKENHGSEDIPEDLLNEIKKRIAVMKSNKPEGKNGNSWK